MNFHVVNERNEHTIPTPYKWEKSKKIMMMMMMI